MDIADDVTAHANADLPGAVNVNSASLDVLACLPGLDRDLAQAIISHRQSDGFFPNIAWLLKVPGITRDILKQLAPLVTARSETFRIAERGKGGFHRRAAAHRSDRQRRAAGRRNSCPTGRIYEGF